MFLCIVRSHSNDTMANAMDLLHNSLTFDLGDKKVIFEKSILSFVKLPRLAGKCCKVKLANFVTLVLLAEVVN